MTTNNRIIPQLVNTSPQIDLVGLNNELERTPGAVAVSGMYGRDLAGASAGCYSPGEVRINPGNHPAGIPKTNSLNPPKQLSYQYTCGTLILVTSCSKESDKYFLKKIVCGKEWCEVCGEDDSQAHNRRIARCLPKFQQISQLGYFVIEFPDRYRKLYDYAYSKKALREVTAKIVDTLAGKRKGRRGRVGGYFIRGYIRWHWFGDKKAGKYNPHANIAVDGAYLDNLEPIKAALKKALNCPDLIVHYSFFDQPGEIYHKLKYITRSTFKHEEWDYHMAHEIYGFRNSRWWGSWKDAAAWPLNDEIEAKAAELQAASKLGSGFCPDCGAPLNKWSKPIDSSHLVLWGAIEYGHTGYYRIPKHEFNGHELSPVEIARLEDLRLSFKEKAAARAAEWAVYLESYDRDAGLQGRWFV